MHKVSRRQVLQVLPGLAAIGGPLAWAGPATAAEPSMCGAAPPPAYPAHDKPALVQSWLRGGHQDGPLPDCGGLRTRDFELLVRLTARFESTQDAAAMLARLGTVSSLKGLPYWSYTDKKRQVLIRESYAVDNPASMKPRADFSPAELRSGAALFFAQSDNRAASLVPYSLQLLSAGPERLMLRVENVADLRYMGLMVVGAHELQWVMALEPLPNGHWGYRSLLGICNLGLGRAEQHRLSNLARSVAMFDHLAGRQTEIERYR
jgi:hypothetical protein